MIMEVRHFIPEILSHQALFRGLDGGELTRLARGTYEYRVGKNEMLFQKGELPAGMHLVITGQVKLTLPGSNGVEKIALMVGPSETFAEECVLSRRPAPVGAQANKDSILLVIERVALQEAMQRNCALAALLMARMGERMCRLIENMETCVQRGSAQRVAHFLAQLAPREAITYDLELDVNKQTIALQLNLAPETFSRVLHKLSRDGLIQMKGRSITLRDVDGLRAIAG